MLWGTVRDHLTRIRYDCLRHRWRNGQSRPSVGYTPIRRTFKGADLKIAGDDMGSDDMVATKSCEAFPRHTLLLRPSGVLADEIHYAAVGEAGGISGVWEGPTLW